MLLLGFCSPSELVRRLFSSLFYRERKPQSHPRYPLQCSQLEQERLRALLM